MSTQTTTTTSPRKILMAVLAVDGIVMLLVVAFFLGRSSTPTPATPTPTLTPMATATPTAPTGSNAAPVLQPAAQDPLLPSLNALGFNSRRELIQFFEIVGVSEGELHNCPGEVACVAITREKDRNGHIEPFTMTNPTSTTFDGWRAASQPGINWDGNQAKVPPGTWYVEGVTIRPWR